MEKIELKKSPYFKIFLCQFGDILAFEAGILICYIFSNFYLLYIIQLMVFPVFLYLIIAKYTKSVTEITLDISNKRIFLRVNYFLLYSKNYDIPFDKVKIKISNKWLLRFYYETIEFKLNNRTIAAIPYKMSIWNNDELDKLKFTIQELAKENLINLTQSPVVRSTH
jgi:hypothetical protein